MKVIENFILLRNSIIKQGGDTFTTLAFCPYYSFVLSTIENKALLNRTKIMGGSALRKIRVPLPSSAKETSEMVDL